MITGTSAASEYEDIVATFREFVGPVEPALAKLLRPESLRLVFVFYTFSYLPYTYYI